MWTNHQSEPAAGTIVPPVLYLPVSENLEGQGQRFTVHPLTDGRSGLLAYTALDRLAACCGEQQPWVMLATPDLGRVKRVQPFDVVAFDVPVPISLRQGGRLR
ncbi:SAV_915 family protein [Microbacterium maritypicum]|uniref:SseB protein N-terminal domain-containing protein n=2 Tax=Microbacterium maritypicum TaxID=33918 RepID=A0AAJ5VAP3_MICMQ|nr:SAV_915 family protein [Microbacterium liquefaciens]UTT52700.1 hypothetical protein NMQ05_16705 [Microbacterium liquefaciens]WEF20744.1 hypothetical protein PWF71_15845 [Microbacterium liquefaciens]